MRMYTLFTQWRQTLFQNKEGYISKAILNSKKKVKVNFSISRNWSLFLINIFLLRKERKGSILADGLLRLLTCTQTLMTFELCATPRKPSDTTSWQYVALKACRQNSRGGLSDTMKGRHTNTNTGNFLRVFLLYTPPWHKSPTLTVPLDKRGREKKYFKKGNSASLPFLELSFIFVQMRTDWAYISLLCLHYIVHFSHGPL